MLNYKLITKNRPVVLDYELTILDNLDEVTQFIIDNKIIGLDTENSGLCPFTGYEYCLQVGDESIQYVIDMLSFKYEDVKPLLEMTGKIFVLQSAQYDLKWFYKHNIVIRSKIWDTHLAELRLTNGFNVRRNLQALEEKYLETSFVDKNKRKDIHTIPNSGYTQPVMKCSAGDVYVLPLLYKKQLEAAEEADMMRIIEMECEAVKAIAYTEFCGVKVDVKKLSDVSIRFNLEAAKAKEYLIKLILKTNNSKYIDPQLSLFDSEPTVSVNFDDTEVMKDILKDIGGLEYADYSSTSEDSDLGWLLRSTTKSSKIVNEYSSYLSNKRKSKLCKSLIQAVNAKTNRIHTSFFQIGRTGRLSTGDKNPNHPNIMGVDKDEMIRSCFIAESGNKMAHSDYDNMEYYIYADLTDNFQIKQELRINADGHTEVARIIFDKELKHLPMEDIRGRYKTYRDAAKTIRFIILNGGNGRTISRKFGCSSTQGNKVYDKYKEAFNIDNKIPASLTIRGIFDGYLNTDDRFGGKYYLKDAYKYVEYINKYKLLGNTFWEKYRDEKEKESDWYDEVKPIVGEFSSYKKEVRTKSLNYLIQGVGSNIFKISLIYFFDKIVEEGEFGVIKIINLINDDTVIEGPSNKIDYWFEALKECMLKAGKIYCKGVELSVSGKVSDNWS